LAIFKRGDEESIRILQNIHKGMKPGARVLVMDNVLPEIGDITDSMGRPFLLDLQMMVIIFRGQGICNITLLKVVCGTGKERTRSEFRNLASQSGFQITRFISTRSQLQIIEMVAQ
jgi:hypothetical protein